MSGSVDHTLRVWKGVRRLAIAAICLGVAAAPARAWKPHTHMYLGEQAWLDATEDGKVTIKCVDYVYGDILQANVGEYAVDPAILLALKRHEPYYRAGIFGPDAYPDILTGQQAIHPDESYGGGTYSNLWLAHLWEEAHKPPFDNSPVKAFVIGYLTHAAGDMFAHTWVNEFTGGPFTLGDNAARHLVLEGYVGKLTPPLRSHSVEVEKVEDFIYEALIKRAHEKGLYRGPGIQFSLPAQYSLARDKLWQRQLAAADPQLYKKRIDDIDAGLKAWPRYSHELARVLMLEEDADGQIKPNLEKAERITSKFQKSHGRRMLGEPEFLIGLQDELDIKMFDNTLRFFKKMHDGFLKALFEFYMGESPEKWASGQMEPEAAFNQLGYALSQSALREDHLGLEAGEQKWKWEKFRPAYNTAVMSKLTLLGPDEVNRLMGDLHSNERLEHANIMLGFIRSLDDSNQFGQMVVRRDPAAYTLIFMRQWGETPTMPTPKVVKLEVANEEVASGSPVQVTVTLDGAAPKPCGVLVRLESRDPELAKVPETVHVPAGQTSLRFEVPTRTVTKRQSVLISAKRVESQAQQLWLNPEDEPAVVAGAESAFVGVFEGTIRQQSPLQDREGRPTGLWSDPYVCKIKLTVDSYPAIMPEPGKLRMDAIHPWEGRCLGPMFSNLAGIAKMEGGVLRWESQPKGSDSKYTLDLKLNGNQLTGEYNRHNGSRHATQGELEATRIK